MQLPQPVLADPGSTVQTNQPSSPQLLFPRNSPTWPSEMDLDGVDASPLRKRRSNTELKRELADDCRDATADGRKRLKAETLAAMPLIVISDDEDDFNFPPIQSLVGKSYPTVPPTAAVAPPDPPAMEQLPPRDHLGRPLSDAALDVAREYWQCQQKLDSCPLDDDGPQGHTLPIDLLIQSACHRRAYTRLLFGPTKLEQGSRTYEPPYVDPLPPAPCPAPGQPPETSGVQGTPKSPRAPRPEPRTEPVLCPEQAELVELAASGANIFYTGSAGCGKSTVLHAIKKRLQGLGKTVQVMAPTGKVALAINGTTTWTFAGWTPDHHKRKLEELKKMARGKTVRKRFRQTDTVIIDEISMVENLHFERLNWAMKSGRSSEAPFGGVQVIVTGDFCQLPPVKPFQHCIWCGSDLVSSAEEEDTIHACRKCPRSFCDSDKWAFRSEAWAECNFTHVHLKSIHRQNDGQFIGMLQKCRLGVKFTPEEIDILMNHRSITGNAVKLFSTREEVRRTNEEAFARLKTPPHPYRCFDRFLWDSKKQPNLEHKGQKNPDGSLRALADHRFERHFELKLGMLVVLLVNLDLNAGLCNGSQGIIAGFEPYEPDKLPRKTEDGRGGIVGSYATIKETHVKQFAEQQLQQQPNGKQVAWPIVRFLNGTTRTIYPECQVHELGDEEPYSLLCRTQIPMAAAWALSIHKSQGMTLDRVVVNLSRAFEEGQVYVALSRATSLEGLKIEGDPQGLAVGAGGNEEVRAFLKEKFGL